MAKITKTKNRLHSKRLAKTYPRVERENGDLSPEHVTEEMAPFLFPSDGDDVHAVTKAAPFDQYELAMEVDLQETLPLFNSLLLYRILKLLYGQPDILGGLFKLNSKEFYLGPGVDWGYTLRILEDLYVEVRSINANNRFKLRYWIEGMPKDLEEGKPYGVSVAKFLEALIDCIDKNAHLFEEEQEIIDDAKGFSATSNIFMEKYKSADEIFSLAKNIDILPGRKDLKFGEPLETRTGGSLYLSSAILFVVALESLINTIFHFLLKPEYQAESYERITIRADLDVRLITAHLFCDGFAKQILTPHTELWKRLLKLRRFRNDIIHGNVTPDDHIYALHEDIGTFYYCGVKDFRGRKSEKKAERKYPTTMAQVNKKIVSEIKETVDMITDAIIEAADEGNRNWLNSWLREAFILKFQKSKKG